MRCRPLGHFLRWSSAAPAVARQSPQAEKTIQVPLGNLERNLVYCYEVTEASRDAVHFYGVVPAGGMLSFSRRAAQMLRNKARQAVDRFDRHSHDFNLSGFQTGTAGGDCDCAGR